MFKPVLILALLATATVPAYAAPNNQSAYQRMCGNVLNLLPQIVPKRDIAAIPDDADVVLHQICTGVDLNSFGNVAGLGRTMAANRAISRTLAQWGYRIDDVVGIQINGNTVQLYVHRS